MKFNNSKIKKNIYRQRISNDSKHQNEKKTIGGYFVLASSQPRLVLDFTDQFSTSSLVLNIERPAFLYFIAFHVPVLQAFLLLVNILIFWPAFALGHENLICTI